MANTPECPFLHDQSIELDVPYEVLEEVFEDHEGVSLEEMYAIACTSPVYWPSSICRSGGDDTTDFGDEG